MKSSLGKASIRTDLVDGRDDESQGDLASVAAIPDTERKRPSVPADGFSLMEKWKSPLHPLSEGAWRFSYQKNWGTSNPAETTDILSVALGQRASRPLRLRPYGEPPSWRRAGRGGVPSPPAITKVMQRAHLPQKTPMQALPSQKEIQDCL